MDEGGIAKAAFEQEGKGESECLYSNLMLGEEQAREGGGGTKNCSELGRKAQLGLAGLNTWGATATANGKKITVKICFNEVEQNTCVHTFLEGQNYLLSGQWE